MLHELAHILDRPTLYEDRHGEDPDKLRFETIVAAYGADQPPPPHLPAYWGHGEASIRIVLHLSYRAKRAGVDVAANSHSRVVVAAADASGHHRCVSACTLPGSLVKYNEPSSWRPGGSLLWMCEQTWPS